MKLKYLLAGGAMAALVAPVAVHAQTTTSTVRGQVYSADGTPISGATVEVVHEPSGTTSRVVTGSDGSYGLSGLRVGGPFTVTVTADGFNAEQVPNIQLTAGEAFRLPLELEPSGSEIVVSGARVARETSDGPISAFSRTDIEGVASTRGDLRDIARRDPFVTLDASNSRTIEIAGQNGRLNRFSVDGVPFGDDFGLNNGGLPTQRGPVPFDAIEQLSVKVAPFDIDEGDFQGGAVNVVLRSGSNTFTGSAYYTYIDESLSGDKIRGQDVNIVYDAKTYGAFLSGPIIPDTLFFAVAYSKLKETKPFDIGPAELDYATPVPRLSVAQLDQVASIAQSVYGYDTLGLLDSTPEEDEKITAKIDWNITDGQRASVTYIRNTGGVVSPNNASASTSTPTLGYEANGYTATEKVDSGVFQLNSDWSSNFSTELRAVYRKYVRGQIPLGEIDFPEIAVCLDPTSITAGPGNNSATTCGSSTTANPTVYLGPDISRHSNLFNNEVWSVGLSAEYLMGNHTFSGLVNYTNVDVFNLFVQRSRGAYYFDSIEDFQNRRASRLQLTGTPSGDLNDAAAQFSHQTWTFGLQDDIELSPTLNVTIGARYDYFTSGDVPPLNQFFLDRYGFSNQMTFDGLGVLQPRFGFNWQPAERVIVRGGVGLFAGGTPDVFLSNSFSNSGPLTNAIDSLTFCGSNPAACDAALVDVNPPSFDPLVTGLISGVSGNPALANVNAIDPDFDVPSQIRATLSASYEADFGSLGDGWLFGFDALYGSTYRGITYRDIRSVQIGTLPDGRPRYNSGFGSTTNQDLLLTNDNRGRSLIGVVRLEKDFDFGLGLGASYTRQDIKDVSPITSATASSLYGNAAMADPNDAAYGRSIYEVKDSLKFTVDYRHAFFGDFETRFSLFTEYHSGRPYSYTFQDSQSGRSGVFGTLGTNTRYLMYVPSGIDDPLVSYDSATTQNLLNDFIDATPGLSNFRGTIVPKNTGTSPGFWKMDLHFDQEIPTFIGNSRIKLFADLENFLNLIDSDLGVQRQVPFSYLARLVGVQCLATATPTGTAPGAGVVNTAPTGICTQYRYSSFSEPNIQVQNQTRQSLWGLRLGVRFEF
jgi:hypothetical protein